MTVPSNETDMERLKILYLEVLDFLHSCGGVYRATTSRICSNVLYSLDTGQYYLQRNDGEITHFCAYRRVTPEELDIVSGGSAKSDSVTLLVTEHGNKGGNIRDLVRYLRRNAGCNGVAWWHKGESFRHFPHQKGGI